MFAQTMFIGVVFLSLWLVSEVLQEKLDTNGWYLLRRHDGEIERDAAKENGSVDSEFSQ